MESWCPPTADQAYLPLGDLIPEHVVPLIWSSFEKESVWNRIAGPYRNVVSHLRAMEEHCRACARQINDAGFDVLFVGACQSFRVTPIAPICPTAGGPLSSGAVSMAYEALPQLPWVAPGTTSVNAPVPIPLGQGSCARAGPANSGP